MRLAIVAASSYARSGKLPELAHAESQAELLCQRLAEPDGAFSVEWLAAERGLPEKIEGLLANPPEPIDALLFFFAGYALVSEEGVPALLLDGERLSTLSLRRVRRLVSQCSPASLVVLDTVGAFDCRLAPPDMVRSFHDAVAGEKAGIHLLASHRVGDSSIDVPSPFTNLLALTLDWHASDDGLSPDALFSAMRREEALFAQIPFAELFEAPAPFHLLVPRIFFSAPPEAAPSPSGDKVVSEADALVAAGDLEGALGRYAVALEQLGPSSTAARPALYAKIASTLRAVDRASDALAYYRAALDLEPELILALKGGAELYLEAGERNLALSLLERWLNVDPNALAAADRMAQLFADGERWEELATLYESVVPRVSEPKVARALVSKIDTLCRGQLKDPSRAIPSIEHAARLAPDDPGMNFRLAELYEDRKAFSSALTHLLAALRADPGNAPGYRTAVRLFDRSGDADGAWNAASALDLLGEADVNESLLASAHRPDGLLPATASVSEKNWSDRLLCPERDARVDELFAALDVAVVEVGLETATRKRRLIAVDASTLHDPNTSTATLLKTLSWSARLLGVSVPRVHVLPEWPTPFVALPTREPTLLVSKALGSGFEMPELAFLWSRALTFLRKEHRPLLFFPSVPELAALLLAGLSLGRVAQDPFKKLEGDAKLFARGLKRHLPADGFIRLQVLADAFPLREASARILAWARATELSANRAGLLACGNVELSAALIRRFPLGGLVEAELQVKDLLAYSVSAEYSSLRACLGVRVAR
jgi:tetratricopeptide (TPR) repeat protein